MTIGFIAGLVPCPLTLFVMTFAILHQVVGTGLLFALSMMLGVTATLGSVALLAVLFGTQLAALLGRYPTLFGRASRSIEGGAGIILASVAFMEISSLL